MKDTRSKRDEDGKTVGPELTGDPLKLFFAFSAKGRPWAASQVVEI